MTEHEPDQETITTEEVARLRRIEEAAKRVLVVMEGKRSATTVLTAIGELRAALKEP